ncbi:MAG: integrin alpha [Planctomycetota bacterium]
MGPRIAPLAPVLGVVSLALLATGTAPCQDALLLRAHFGEGDDHHLGLSVAGLGDIDGDGVPDYAVGAPFWSGTAGPERGKVYVHSGVDGSLIRAHAGAGVFDDFGFSIASAGDVDGDGAEDLLVGAWSFNGPAGQDAGRAYIYSGGDGSLIRVFDGEEALDEFGSTVSGAGDVNGDGVGDQIISAPFHSLPGSSGDGRVYVFSGSDGTLLHIVNGTALGQGIGTSLAGAGDLDGDGRGEFAVGAIAGGPGMEGSVIVYSGLDGTPLRVFTGENPVDFFGRSVANVGDLDGDGFDELAVGAPFADTPDRGRVYVYSGLDGSLIYSRQGTQNSFLGTSVAAAGDVDGDGTLEVAVGAPQLSPPGGAFAGGVFLYSGAAGILVDVIEGEQPAGGLGISLAGIGPLDCVGESELIVGGDFIDAPGGSNNGAALVVVFEAIDPEPFHRGDVDGDGAAAVADALAALGYLFQLQGAPPCLSAADVNDDGRINIVDPIFLLNHIFSPTPPPVPAPAGSCGFDTTADLVCCEDPPCP